MTINHFETAHVCWLLNHYKNGYVPTIANAKHAIDIATVDLIKQRQVVLTYDRRGMPKINGSMLFFITFTAHLYFWYLVHDNTY